VPNSDNLRKRAKSLVKQHRSGNYPVATRIRRALPRFAGLPDQAVLAEKFALSDALEVIARELGFADWPEAKKRMRQMAKRPDHQPNALKVLIAQPQILVSEVTRAASFYADMLGFAVVFLYGEPPFYGMVARDGAALNLRRVDDPARFRDASQRDVLTAYIPVNGVKALFLEYQGRGVPFVRTLAEQPWGATDFLIRDPDGNLLCFASPANDWDGALRDRL
jgi:catechol 2,3-dioxygenase-like lactoylglutathione lyase family enzyme